MIIYDETISVFFCLYKIAFAIILLGTYATTNFIIQLRKIFTSISIYVDITPCILLALVILEIKIMLLLFIDGNVNQ